MYNVFIISWICLPHLGGRTNVAKIVNPSQTLRKNTYARISTLQIYIYIYMYTRIFGMCSCMFINPILTEPRLGLGSIGNFNQPPHVHMALPMCPARRWRKSVPSSAASSGSSVPRRPTMNVPTKSTYHVEDATVHLILGCPHIKCFLSRLRGLLGRWEGNW